jgi:hypothetical protein
MIPILRIQKLHPEIACLHRLIKAFSSVVVILLILALPRAVP